LHANALFDTKSHIASGFMKKFLTETSEIHLLKTKMYSFYGKMRKIQTNFREFKTAQENRVVSYAKIQWEREKQALLKQCMTKKTKLKNVLWKKLNLIEPAVRDAVIKVYMLRCKKRYLLRFLQWRLDYHFASVSDDLVNLRI